jgi:hypothetical protein
VVQEPQAGDARGDREQDRHVQAPAPVEHLGEQAAEQQAERAAGARDRAVDAERLAALCRVCERGGEQRQRGRRQQRGEGALQRAGRDQQAEALRGAAERGRAGEAEQAGDERPLAPEQVGDPAAEQQQAAERERVRRDDPLAVVVGEAEVGLGGGERDVDDRHVEDDQQLGDADDPEDQPPAVGMGVCHWEGLQDGRGSGGPARAWPGASPPRVLVPGSGWRSGGDVESVPDVDQGDLDDQRGQGLLVVVRVGLLPDVIGHRVGTVA